MIAIDVKDTNVDGDGDDGNERLHVGDDRDLENGHNEDQFRWCG